MLDIVDFVFSTSSSPQLFVRSLRLYLKDDGVSPFVVNVTINGDRLCGLVVRVPGYRSRGLGSIPGSTTFSEK
jgi:hypothetical protein